jgi:transcriptional regulator with XRE-family HTH domain
MSNQENIIETLRTGDLIRHGRMSLGMTQAELASYLSQQNAIFNGVDTVTISRWEAGRVYPSTKRLIAFAKILYPQHTRTTLKYMIKDRPRGHQECKIGKVNAFHPHPYLLGEAHRALAVSDDISRLTSGTRRCIDPYFPALTQDCDKANTLKLVVLDPNTQEIFGHMLAFYDNSDATTGTSSIVISSVYAGSDKIFEFLFSNFFRFAVQQEAQSIQLISGDSQQRALAKRLGLTQSRTAAPQAIQPALSDREGQIYVGEYFETLAHPDFIALFASDIAPYPELENKDSSVQPQDQQRVRDASA